MIRSLRGFLTLSIETYRLLSQKDRVIAIRSIFFSFIISIAEVLSLSTLMPLLLSVSGVEFTDNPLGHYVSGLLETPWQVILAGILVAFLSKNLLALWHTQYQSRFISNISTSMSEERYRQFYRQSWTTFLNGNSAESVRKIKSVPFDFTTYVLQNYLQVVTDVCICIVMAALTIIVNYSIILMTAALCIPIMLCYYFFQKRVISKIDKSFREHTPQTSIFLTQGIDSFAEARLYDKESFFIDLFIRLRRITNNNLANLKTAMQLPSRLFETVGILCFAAIIGYARSSRTSPQETILLLGFFSIVLYRIVPSLNRILTSISQIQAYAYTVADLKESFSFGNDTSPSETITFMKTLQLDNIRFQYDKNGKTAQLDHLNFAIHRGDFVMLSGPSGSGKTTLIHIMAGLISDYDGVITIDGKSLTPRSLKAWQSRIGFVAQSPIVLQDTLLNNILFGSASSTENIHRANQVLKTVGLAELVRQLPQAMNTPAGENGLMLSGGQRQRLVLARALFRNPQVLLLDEVINQLDEENKMTILLLLQELVEKGITVILASHDPIVRKFATRVLDFSEQKITDASTH